MPKMLIHACLTSGKSTERHVQFMANGKLVDLMEYEITDDLPADALGENLADFMQKVWRSGYDPTTLMINVQYE